MIEKNRILFLFAILLIGFVLRIYSAGLIPPTHDEMDDLSSTQKISFNLQNPNLPLVDTRRESAPIAFKYIARIGWDLFGDSLLGARIPFVLLSIVIIVLVYHLTHMIFGVQTALLASLLLSISHYDIGIGRTANINPPQVFFFILSILTFLKALNTNSKKLLLLNGAIIGCGFWVKESVVFLIPIYVIYLLVCKEHRQWLKNKYFWCSFVVAAIFMMPLIILNLNPEVPRFNHVYSEAAIGPSLNSIGMYLGELIIICIKPIPHIFDAVAKSVDMEYPIVNFVVGICILLGVGISIKNRDPMVRLLVVCFLFNFIFFCLLRRRDVVDNFWSIGSFDWGVLGFVPGIILAAHMLIQFSKNSTRLGPALLTLLIAFMFFRAINLVRYPLNGYFPLKNYFLESELNWANLLLKGQHDSDIYFPPGGNKVLARQLYQKIHSVSDHIPKIQKQAAYGLYQLKQK